MQTDFAFSLFVSSPTAINGLAVLFHLLQLQQNNEIVQIAAAVFEHRTKIFLFCVACRSSTCVDDVIIIQIQFSSLQNVRIALQRARYETTGFYNFISSLMHKNNLRAAAQWCLFGDGFDVVRKHGEWQ